MLAILAALNYKGIILATIVYFALGWLWYSPFVFGKVWMTEARVPAGTGRQSNKQMTVFMVSTLVLYFIAALVLNLFLGPLSTPLFGVFIGMLIGLGWLATSVGVTSIYERRSWKYFFITAGHQVIGFMIMGLILGWLK